MRSAALLGFLVAAGLLSPALLQAKPIGPLGIRAPEQVQVAPGDVAPLSIQVWSSDEDADQFRVSLRIPHEHRSAIALRKTKSPSSQTVIISGPIPARQKKIARFQLRGLKPGQYPVAVDFSRRIGASTESRSISVLVEVAPRN